jgi:hypothetical protein
VRNEPQQRQVTFVPGLRPVLRLVLFESTPCVERCRLGRLLVHERPAPNADAWGIIREHRPKVWRGNARTGCQFMDWGEERTPTAGVAESDPRRGRVTPVLDVRVGQVSPRVPPVRANARGSVLGHVEGWSEDRTPAAVSGMQPVSVGVRKLTPTYGFCPGCC